MVGPRAYIFFALNVVRFLSIVSLILVFASSIFVIVTDVEAVNAFEAAKQSGNVTAQDFADCEYIENSTVPNQIGGVFWAVINRLLIIFQVVMLFLSEIGWPSAFFDRFFPVLGTGFGLGALGIFQGLIGAAVLSQHVDDFTLVSAFFLFVLGCINMFLGLLFRESAKSRRSITSWREEAKGVLPTTNLRSAANLDLNRSGSSGSGQSSTSSTVYDEKTGASEFGAVRNGSRAGYGFGRQGEKAAGLRGFLISKPIESLPRYAARPTSIPSRSSRTSRSPSPEPHFASSGSAI
ncbi:hypothetical protein DFJ58DRAFT_913395 [Suillus subalutaceus]|uniref:uncharacterized protein n=1 Tax=Suillus subalutaceus TaxID=48586 RepID=UPI001B85D954|nr:uncharacterized protein DFJ58DRAFT_913395 [Suillus subalutaceus]KAG1858063.1 hypothetical protein DFJ58DRAFT_913395 [Suillus subalutaceus]